jgi:hypothetical protein
VRRMERCEPSHQYRAPVVEGEGSSAVPRRLPLAACDREHVLDERCLAVLVGRAVVMMSAGEGALEVPVVLAGVRVGAQVVSERHVREPAFGVEFGDVQVVGRAVVRESLHEVEPAGPVVLGLVEVPEWREGFLEARRVGHIADGGHNVENRLGIQTGNGGAADVLDAEHVIAESRAEALGLLAEQTGPGWLVGHECHAVSSAAEHSAASPWEGGEPCDGDLFEHAVHVEDDGGMRRFCHALACGHIGPLLNGAGVLQRSPGVGRRLHLAARADKLGMAEHGALTWEEEPFLEQELVVSI